MAFSNPERNIEQLGLSQGAQVADFGVGSGAYTLAAARKVGETGTVYAIDVQRGLIDRVKNLAQDETLENVEVLEGDLEHAGGSKLGDASVDVVIIANVLFQIENKDVCIQEALRILRPKGRVLCIDWKDSFGGLGPHADAVLPFTAAKELFERNGLSVEKQIQAGDHHYGVVLRRR